MYDCATTIKSYLSIYLFIYTKIRRIKYVPFQVLIIHLHLQKGFSERAKVKIAMSVAMLIYYSSCQRGKNIIGIRLDVHNTHVTQTSRENLAKQGGC